MAHFRLWLLSGGMLLATASLTLRAEPPTELARKALTAKIDQVLLAAWRSAQIEPAPRADDAEFLRRVYLDLAGRIPSVAEARAFLRDTAPDKRQRLVKQILDSPRYVTHFTSFWRALLLPEATTAFQVRFLVPGFEAWIRKQLASNVGYDQLVRELLTAPLSQDGMRGVYARGQIGAPTPLAFYMAKEFKPENLAASTSRAFLGIRLECAQCHNHFFASWQRDQFWSYAAFFAGVQGQSRGDVVQPGREVPYKKEITIPGSERAIQASFLDGSEPQWKYKVSTRATLAEWMTARENPYFARAAVNRLWAYLMGTGLIEPVDEMVGSESIACHPELLDELARSFAAHDYDLKFLLQAIIASRAYQLTSAARPGATEEDPRLFARMPVRGLAPEQLLDSLVQATGFSMGPPLDARVRPDVNSPQTEFLTKFTSQSDKATEQETSIIQALALINGKLISDATSLERSEMLAAVADAPFLNTAERIETLYLATLSRLPRPRESERLIRYLESSGTSAQSRNTALADILWALLNSGEFILNH